MVAQTQLQMLDVSQYAIDDDLTIEKNERNRYNRWKNFYKVYAYDYTAYHEFCVALWGRNNLIKLLYDIQNTNAFECMCVWTAILFSLNYEKDEIKFREWFYALDDNGEKQHLGDCKHIFRTNTLYKIQNKIHNFCENYQTAYEGDAKVVQMSLWQDVPKIKGITVYNEVFIDEVFDYKRKKYVGKQFVERFAEIDNTWRLPIKQRVIIHIRLLRLLKQGFTIQEAFNELKR